MADIISPSEVFLDNPATTKEELIDFLSTQAKERGIATNKSQVEAAFMAREQEGSTGMVGGFAIPHAKSSAVIKPAVFVVKLKEPIEAWETMDRKNVRVAIALFIPEGQAGTNHLRLLSKVAVLLMQPHFVQTVLEAHDQTSIAQALNDGIAA